MTLRVATTLSALALAAPLAAAAPAEASPCRSLSPVYGCTFVTPREARMIRVAMAEAWSGPSAWQRWTPAPRPFTRFDVEGVRLMTRMP
jgi:hypothetical protein